MIYLVGYERSAGEFVPEGDNKLVPYDNVIIHTLDTNCNVDGFVGCRSEKLKIKFNDVPKIFGCTYDELIGFVKQPIVLHMGIINGYPKLQHITLDNVAIDSKLGDFMFNEDTDKKK